MPECSTRALHCVRCGRPSQLMQGALTDCCQARVTRATTCDGKHPTYELGPGAPPDAIDEVMVPHLVDLVQALVATGREPAAAIADLERAVTIVRARMEAELPEVRPDA